MWVRPLAQPQSQGVLLGDSGSASGRLRGCFWETAGAKEEDALNSEGGSARELLLKQPLPTHSQVLPTYSSGKIPNGRKETINPEPELSALHELSKHRLICKRNGEQ